jgi:hypothetical protein
MAFPFVPVGLGAIAVIGLGWLLLGGSKPAVAAPAPAKTPGKAVTTTAPGVAIAYPPDATTPYGTSPGFTPSSDQLKGEGSGRAVGARYGIADRDASRANDSLTVMEEPSDASADFITGFRIGFVAGYNAEYWKPVSGKKSGAATPTKEAVAKDWRTEGYTAGYAQGAADATSGFGYAPSDTSRVPTGIRGKPSVSEVGEAGVNGWNDGYGGGYVAGYGSVSSSGGGTSKASTDSSSGDSSSSDGSDTSTGLSFGSPEISSTNAYIEPAFNPYEDYPYPYPYGPRVRVGAWGPSRGLILADAARMRSTGASLVSTVGKCRAWGYSAGRTDALSGKPMNAEAAIYASKEATGASDPSFRNDCARAILAGYKEGYAKNKPLVPAKPLTVAVRNAPSSPSSPPPAWMRW